MFYACHLEIVYILYNIEFYAPRECALQSDSLASLHVGREENVACPYFSSPMFEDDLTILPYFTFHIDSTDFVIGLFALKP